jgi:hypothetical protein
MLVYLLLNVVVAIACQAPAGNVSVCLPKDIKPADVVSATAAAPGRTAAKVTVAQVLRKLRTHCRRGKLVDARGKEIYFYRMQGCWGNPPPDYQEVLAQQTKELEKLRQHYRVIEMTCNPTGEPLN